MRTIMIKNTALFTAAALAVAALAAGAIHQYAGRARSAVATAGARGGSEQAGRQRRWALQMEAGLRSTDSTSPGVTTVLSSDWVETISGSTPSSIDMACELDHAHVTGITSGSASPEKVAALEKRLARRIWITIQRDGAATRIHFPSDMDDQVRNLLQLVVTTRQLVRPQVPAPRRMVAGACCHPRPASLASPE